MKKLQKLLLLLALSVSMAAVPVSAPMAAATEATSTEAKINRKTIVLIKGQTTRLKVVGAPNAVTWTSSKQAVATVNKSGKVTAKKKGVAKITAKADGKNYSCKVTVQTPSINRKTVTLYIGETTALKMNGTNQKTIWNSSNQSVASVNSNGIVTAKKTGTSTITATVLKKEYTCKITVRRKASTPPATPSVNQVWLSATGSKYHKIPNCGRMNPNRARKISLSEAKAKGYSPCSKCF